VAQFVRQIRLLLTTKTKQHTMGLEISTVGVDIGYRTIGETAPKQLSLQRAQAPRTESLVEQAL
jgi:hypothetical protein